MPSISDYPNTCVSRHYLGISYVMSLAVARSLKGLLNIGKPSRSSNLTTSHKPILCVLPITERDTLNSLYSTLSSSVSMPASVPNKMCVVCWCEINALMPSISD
ncbi:hypothetical protein CDAR_473401 [Caerostris darwini]|uniref:Uncharacterized protein n=1 Tax=Caerostris darwini TaxID=1538125 RepID=A0AAV4USJ2_9ARAC|nr:hypothetical protein CDAR_473401 [Caerostris darwini]